MTVRVRQPLVAEPPQSFPVRRAAIIQTDLSAHEAASDPHPGYETTAESLARQYDVEDLMFFLSN